ncbi:MAG: amidohydrolase family protein, partial [Clostridia bacterium]|nr:amidohydrolase family protein [Clostridia bacterium]
DHLALVTDSMRAAGMPEGPSILGAKENGLPVIVEEGVAKLTDRSAFAGSVATADRLVRTMVGARIPLVDAVYMITASPARIMGFRDRGTLSPGTRADFTLFDEEIRVVRTIVGGQVICADQNEKG